MREALGKAAWPVAFAVVAAVLAWPLRRGEAYLDDFAFLAIGRHLDAPWLLLVQDSLGTFFFRPVAMFLWWLSVQAFGTAGGVHLILNAMVHVANGALLAWLLRRLGLSRAAAVAAGLVFAAHPTAFAAASWLSDRFDLFAAFFGLLGLVAVEAHGRRGGAARASLALACLAAAVLSKEIAFAFAACACLLAASHRRRGLAGAVIVLVLAVLAVRPFVLRDASDPFLVQGLLATLAGGMAKWLRDLPEFGVVWHGHPLAVAAAAAGLLLGAVLAGGALVLRGSGLRPRRVAIAGAMLLTVLATAAQAPVVNASPLFTFTDGFTFEALAGSRFYYVPLLGLVAAGAALLDGLATTRTRRRLAAAVVAFTLAGLVAQSRTIGREWAQDVADRITPLRTAATEIVRAVTAPPRGCKLYFLEMPATADGFRVLLDEAVKAGLPRGHPAMGCLLQAEHTPWYHVAARDALAPADVAPLEVILFEGRPYPPLPLGNLTLHYLKATQAEAIRADPAARFFAWRGGRFVDVTQAMRRGEVAVRFHDNR